MMLQYKQDTFGTSPPQRDHKGVAAPIRPWTSLCGVCMGTVVCQRNMTTHETLKSPLGVSVNGICEGLTTCPGCFPSAYVSWKQQITIWRLSWWYGWYFIVQTSVLTFFWHMK